MRIYFVCLFQFLTTALLLSQSNRVPLVHPSVRVASPVISSKAEPKAQARILDRYGELPLSFEANQGQADGRVKFLSRTGAYSLFLTADEAVLALRGKQARNGKATASAVLISTKKTRALAPETASSVLRMKLRNANSAAKVTGMDELAGTNNYFIGNDPEKWRTNVRTYAKVKYEGVYSGIDLVYYGNQRQLEYDFIVTPGADPSRIAFDVSGAKRIHQDEHGELVFKTKTGENEIHWQKPVVYQEKDGTRQPVAAHYAITDTNRATFELAKYDASRPLYIDPLIYSTYLGGSAADGGAGIAVDSMGNAYVAGQTSSTNFPTTPGALQTNADCSGSLCLNAFVSKINSSGTALVFSTYLGADSDASAASIAVDSSGNAYVTGSAGSGFPLVNALQSTYGGDYDTFVAKINPSGSALVYSTYLGGSGQDLAYGIAVDSAGNAYVAGNTGSSNFPITPKAFQTVCNGGVSPCGDPNRDAFVSKINPTGSALVYSTYLGGSGDDIADSIAVDSAGNAYITGSTGSTNSPTQNPLQPTNHSTYAGCPCNAFVTKLDSSGSALVYSTYLGGA